MRENVEQFVIDMRRGGSGGGQVSGVARGQEALEKKLGMLETHQVEIHEALLAMETEALRLYQVPNPPPLPLLLSSGLFHLFNFPSFFPFVVPRSRWPPSFPSPLSLPPCLRVRPPS